MGFPEEGVLWAHDDKASLCQTVYSLVKLIRLILPSLVSGPLRASGKPEKIGFTKGHCAHDRELRSSHDGIVELLVGLVVSASHHGSLLAMPRSFAGSHGALGKLEKMGFPREAFYGAITSGEVCYQALQNRPDDFYKSLGKRCVHITWGARGPISLGDLDLEVPILTASATNIIVYSLLRK